MSMPPTDNFSDFEHTREHLANERTFLAWVRTSLGIIGLGFVVVKFSLFVREMQVVVTKKDDLAPHGYSLPLGILLIAIGTVVATVGYFRFRRIQKRILQSQFFPSNTLIKIMMLLLVLAGILLIAYLWITT